MYNSPSNFEGYSISSNFVLHTTLFCIIFQYTIEILYGNVHFLIKVSFFAFGTVEYKNIFHQGQNNSTTALTSILFGES